MSNVSVEYRHGGHREDRREVPHDVWPADGPDRVGRFSDGLESRTHEGENRRIGRFSDGQELIRGVRARVGRFSEGVEARSGR